MFFLIYNANLRVEKAPDWLKQQTQVKEMLNIFDFVFIPFSRSHNLYPAISLSYRCFSLIFVMWQ